MFHIDMTTLSKETTPIIPPVMAVRPKMNYIVNLPSGSVSSGSSGVAITCSVINLKN